MCSCQDTASHPIRELKNNKPAFCLHQLLWEVPAVLWGLSEAVLGRPDPKEPLWCGHRGSAQTQPPHPAGSAHRGITVLGSFQAPPIALIMVLVEMEKKESSAFKLKDRKIAEPQNPKQHFSIFQSIGANTTKGSCEGWGWPCTALTHQQAIIFPLNHCIHPSQPFIVAFVGP